MLTPSSLFTGLDVTDAISIVENQTDGVLAYQEVAACGMDPLDILPYAKRVAAGTQPCDPFTRARKPRPVLPLWSVLTDPQWYAGVLDLGKGDMKRLTDLYRADPKAAYDKVWPYLKDICPDFRRSDGPRLVDFDGPAYCMTTGTNEPGATASPEVGDLLRPLSMIVKAFRFDPVKHGEGPGTIWILDLGWATFVVARSRDLCVAVGSLTRILGRDHPTLRRWVWWLDHEGRMVPGDCIPACVPNVRMPPNMIGLCSPERLVVVTSPARKSRSPKA